MIDHIWSDGSIGHEYEIGDRVKCKREDYSLFNKPLGHVGMEGTVIALEPYGRNSTYHTTFVRVRLDNGGGANHLSSDFFPGKGQEPCCCIIEEVDDD